MERAALYLQDVATQLISALGTEVLYERILDAAMSILNSDFACIQVFYPERGALRLLGYRGFSDDSAKRWKWVYPGTRSTCGEALRTGQRIAVEDIRTCDFISGTDDLQEYLGAGIHAVQTTPLVSRSGAFLGMVSTHWREPHKMSATELRALDILARMAADLIERSRAEERLRDSEERLRSSEVQLKDAQRLARTGSWERNIEAGTSQWSDEMLRILGLPKDADFSAFIDCVHPRDRQKVLEREGNIYSARGPVELEFRIIRQDGEVRVLRSIAERITDDRNVLLRIVVTAQDITDQVEARELLRESEARLKSAERLAQVGHWSWNIKTDRVYWSEEVYRIFDRPADYIPAYSSYLQLLPQQDRDRVDQWVRDCLAEKRGKPIEHRVVRSNGELRIVTCVSEVSLDEQGAPVALLGTVQDITEARRGQEESLARQRLEGLGTLAKGVAHDFNNLLAGVLAQTELALEQLTAESSPEKELWNIRKAALGGSEIVRQLLIYAGKESASVRMVDLSQAVQEMLEPLKVSVSKRALLEANLGQDLPKVRANGAQIRQIVMNLVMNASDAIGDQDGVIGLTTRFVKSGTGSSGEIPDRLADRDHLQLAISDNGRGMSPEIQTKEFDPFFTTKSAGHGLRLAVVDGVVRDLGGEIHVTSQVDKGSTFQILLPCDETAAVETRNPGPATEGLARLPQGVTVLIVEDEDMLRSALSIMLRQAGVEVFEAADGSSAIEILRAHGGKVDVMLLDLTLPGASSQEIVAEASKGRPDIKVMFTSAYSREMVAKAIDVVQIHDFIEKPFRVADFMKKLRNILSW
jgi:two-component system, cell cycle sensor histidine kinase and response regulator CckA